MASRPHGFTLVELLTVIAIIAVLAAILFPVAGTVREQARAGDCMSKLHQIWVAVNMYKNDEGSYPPALMGYVELPDHSYAAPGDTVWVPADRIVNGFLYREQVRDVNVFRCADNGDADSRMTTIAHFPPRPPAWPASYPYIGDQLAGLCGTDAAGTIDCHTSGPLAGQPRMHYAWNSYDIGPRVNWQTGEAIEINGVAVYDVHYSRDWTGALYAGLPGANDWPAQLKYSNPPDDRTYLTHCTWHGATAGSTTAPAISMGGTAKKVSLKLLAENGAYLFSR